ncbi:hypothetical protein ANO14919_145570 [Xylariales sp. No.14919]|nr:hypothetical protein ANO14919_145570 [Xylariales sp. No.14919]
MATTQSLYAGLPKPLEHQIYAVAIRAHRLLRAAATGCRNAPLAGRNHSAGRWENWPKPSVSRAMSLAPASVVMMSEDNVADVRTPARLAVLAC